MPGLGVRRAILVGPSNPQPAGLSGGSESAQPCLDPSNPCSITSTSTQQQYMTQLQDSVKLCLDVSGQVSADDEVGFRLHRLCLRGAPPAHRAPPVGHAVGPAADPARSAQRPTANAASVACGGALPSGSPLPSSTAKRGAKPLSCQRVLRGNQIPSPDPRPSLLPPTRLSPPPDPSPISPPSSLAPVSSSPHTLTASLLPTHPPLSSPRTLTSFRVLLPTRGGGPVGPQEAGGSLRVRMSHSVSRRVTVGHGRCGGSLWVIASGM